MSRRFLPLAVALLALSGCKSHWIEATVYNHSGHPVEELEVDYPSASFGLNSLAADASYHYRFQVRNSGPVKIVFHFPDDRVHTTQGLNLTEADQGSLAINILPDGQANFVPAITTSR